MICTDLHSELSRLVRPYAQDQIVVVRDAKTQGVVIEGFDYPTLWMCVDESAKSLETVRQIWDFLFDQRVTRRGLLVAIGGGCLTDMAGFAASTYLRGIPYVNVPTTLLAMVDASTGGKTGFNYRGLKNSIGVFAPPVETLISVEWLPSLPAEQFLSGYGELLKTGLVKVQRDKGQSTKGQGTKGKTLWDALLVYDLERMPIEDLTPLIEACVAAKEEIVAEDPKEEGLRKALNFGHTFGHALEEIALGTMPHGYAVVYGMIAELYLSVVRCGCPHEVLQQLSQIMLHFYGKPQCKCSDYERIIELMQQDKKNERAAEINCTLIASVGTPVINQLIPKEEALEALDYLFSL